MEFVLRTELVSSAHLHALLRSHLVLSTQIKCTDCAVATCERRDFQDCVAQCMQPCVRFKLQYEETRKALIEVSDT